MIWLKTIINRNKGVTGDLKDVNMEKSLFGLVFIITSGKGYRMLMFDNYMAFYKIHNKDILILRVLHMVAETIQDCLRIDGFIKAL